MKAQIRFEGGELIALILGGTGTLGKEVVKLLLRKPRIERIRILSRGEHTQMQMAEAMEPADLKRVDFFVGDIRDRDRLLYAADGASYVYHFAAMKSVDKAEYDPWEAVQTNIHGTKNVIEACLRNQVEKAIFTSTDKAVAPINIYGATKLCAEKLFIQANIGKHRTSFGVCRYGNVLGSNGSVLSKWKTLLQNARPIKITHEEMTRFFILPAKAADFVVNSMEEMRRGEVFIPKMKSTTMINLARALSDHCGKTLKLEDIEWAGIRPGEKIHEMLISSDEVELTTDDGDKYIRWPNQNLFPYEKRGDPIKKGFSSYDAKRFTPEELKELIQCQSES